MIRTTLTLILMVMCAACITSVETSFDDDGPVKTDGELDCTSLMQWSLQGAPAPDAMGSVTAEEALRDDLDRYRDRFGGEIEFVREGVGSLVIDGREQVVSVASRTAGGGWFVTTTSGCESFELNPGANPGG